MRERISRLIAEAEHRARWLRSPLRPVVRAYVSAYGTTVRAGPFAGLRYPERVISHVTTAVPKLVGSYERELHEVVERAIEAGPSSVITAGSADGYYAVGLARRLPGATVHGFDVEPHWRRICAQVAAENGLRDRVVLGERLEGSAFGELPVDGALVVIDCDGCEEALFSPDSVVRLAGATVLVETHDHLVPGVTDRLLERFAATHSAEVIEAQPRWISEFPEIESLEGVSYVDRELAISEFRPHQRWISFTPRGS